MRVLSAPVLAALEARNVTIRDFLWIEARDRTTGAPLVVGYWSDLGAISAEVEDPRTGLTVSRSFRGAGGLVDISAITLSANLSVQTVDITMSQIADPNDLIRAYDVKQARVEIFRGLFAPASLVQLAPAFPRFVGYIDNVTINTPTEGSEGSIGLACVSHSQEMSRFNTETRSDADSRIRNSADSFNRHAAVVGTWEMSWGKATSNTGGVPAAAAATRPRQDNSGGNDR